MKSRKKVLSAVVSLICLTMMACGNGKGSTEAENESIQIESEIKEDNHAVMESKEDDRGNITGVDDETVAKEDKEAYTDAHAEESLLSI